MTVYPTCPAPTPLLPESLSPLISGNKGPFGGFQEKQQEEMGLG